MDRSFAGIFDRTCDDRTSASHVLEYDAAASALKPGIDGSPPPLQSPPPSSLTPFAVFDAPIELRLNFLRSATDQGIPTSSHANEIYNLNAIMCCPREFGRSRIPFRSDALRYTDARYDRRHVRRTKRSQERERARRIVEKIYDIRQLMARDGVPVPSDLKTEVLNSLPEYVRHLQKNVAAKARRLREVRREILLREEDAGSANSSSGEESSSAGDDRTASRLGEESFAAIFRTSSQPLAVAGFDGTILLGNDRFLRLLGLSEESVGHASLFNLVQRGFLARLYNFIAKLLQLARQSQVHDDLRLLSQDFKTDQGLSMQISPIFSYATKMLHLHCYVQTKQIH